MQIGKLYAQPAYLRIEALPPRIPLRCLPGFRCAASGLRCYRNVHQDVTMLSEWLVIEKDASGKVFVPWDEIDVQFPLQRLASVENNVAYGAMPVGYCALHERNAPQAAYRHSDIYGDYFRGVLLCR